MGEPMKLLKLTLAVLATAVLVPAQSFASFALPLSLGYTSSSVKSGSVTSTTSTMGGTLTFGYLFDTAPLFLGAGYTYFNTGGNVEAAKGTTTAYGATVGMMTENLHLLFTYIISSQIDYTGTGFSGTGYKKGSGFDLKIAYLMGLGGNFSLGPQIVYSSIKYTETATGITADYTQEVIQPQIAMNVKF